VQDRQGTAARFVPGAMLIIPDRGILCAAHAPRMRACDS